MPTYEYACPSCKHTFELFQMMSEAPKKKCPECGKKVQRLFGTGSGIVFKGTGFYQTDYKKTSGAPAAPAAKAKDAAPAPAAKTETKKTDKSAKKGGRDA